MKILRLLAASTAFVFVAGLCAHRIHAASPSFTHPLAITNPYLPLASLRQDILEGTEKGRPLRIERTRMPGNKLFTIDGQSVEAMIVEDREFASGKLSEVTLDYFAQDDDGNVYYLGEDVDNYRNGKVVGHGGSWHFGKGSSHLGLLMPAHPQVGQKFRSEDLSPSSFEEDEVVSLSAQADVPASHYENCLRIKEHSSDGETEFKLYAPGVGAIREEDALLKSHN